MNRRRIKKIFFVSISSILLLVLVLVIHIYLVTKPAINEHTRVMARVDLLEHIMQSDADKITTWLYSQKGVDHVFVNPVSAIAVFTYSPMITNGDKLVNDLNTSLHFNAKRFKPTQQQLQSSCPVAANSFSFKIYRMIENIF